MYHCNSTLTPITHETERKLKNVQNINNDIDISKIPFRQAIGTLLYLSNGTRPDLSYVLNVISRKQSNYTIEDWMRIKRYSAT